MSTVTGFDVDRAVIAGACRRCSTERAVVWHDESVCPLWAAAEERERQVPCRSIVCFRVTTRNDGCCSDLCAARVRRAS